MFSSNRPNATDPDHTGRRAGGDRSAGGPANRRRIRPMRVAATAAIALTVGLAAPACATDDGATAEPTATGPATGDAVNGTGTATETNGANGGGTTETGEADPRREETYANRLAFSIERAQADGYISEEDEWVADRVYGDPVYGIIAGEDTEAAAEVVTIAGGTGSSPQAVMLYSVGHGNYSTVAEPPPEMAGALMFGHRTGNVRSVEQSPSAITVVWTHPDLPDREVTYTFEEGEYHADL